MPFIFQYELTVQRAVPLCQDAAERGNVCEQMLQLGDLLLDGFCVQLQKMRSETQAVKYQELTDMYQQQRRAIIQPLSKYLSINMHICFKKYVVLYIDSEVVIKI